MILLIDNYDSFSYNLYQLIGEINPDINVIRNDVMSVAAIRALAPEKIIISPGPGRPEDAGVCPEVIRELHKELPILGVCLGHQAICQVFGAEVTYAKTLMHGKYSVIKPDAVAGAQAKYKSLYDGLGNEELKVARYHSLAASDTEGFPSELIITAKADDGEIMSVQHKDYPLYGLQYHPESVLTPRGRTILRNFVERSTNDAN
ncbi:MAG: aminodeoxychorismate/anthranilate synthase component II [Clostridiales Family XIII bacterium]|jgi:anthranilate synthase component 2|nr:aminodeoxychorismate/anthranilate synthase component II [Clostridiales Family XIII bacterium]